MFVRVKKKDDSRWQITIVESVREGKKVKQKTIRNIGTAHSQKEVDEFRRIGDAAIIEIKNALKPVLSFAKPEDFHAPRRRQKPLRAELVDMNDLREASRINEGFPDVFARLFSDVGLKKSVIGTREDALWNDIIEALVVDRIFDPKSKLATVRHLQDRFDINIPPHKVYRAMDKLIKSEDRVKSIIRNHTLGLFTEKVDVLFFDVTTLYFESISSDELKDFGFSKDCKFKEVQVMLALIATHDGLPVTYKLFPGNTFEGHTLEKTVSELKKDFDVENFIFVADRGMFNEKNLEYMDDNNIGYVVGACLKKLPKKLKSQILTDRFTPDVVANELHWIGEFEHKSRRLIVSYSSKRARKDSRDRERLIERLLKKTKEGKLRLKDLIPNYGTKKYLEVSGGEAKINEAKITQDAQWDGLHGVITNQTEQKKRDILERYRGLWQIEEAFRVNKHSLKMRPIFHWTPKRIKAHVLICFMSFSLIKYANRQLKKAKCDIGFTKLKEQLSLVDASIVQDTKNNKQYVIPAHVTELQKDIYRAFNLSRSDKPYAI